MKRVTPAGNPGRVSGREPVAPSAGAPPWSGWLAAGLLAALGLAVYANALGNPFATDDRTIILDDIRVRQGDIRALLAGSYWPPPSRDVLYRPLVKATYALNLWMSDRPAAFRVPNLILHVAVAWLVFLLTRDLIRAGGGRLSGDRPAAARPGKPAPNWSARAAPVGAFVAAALFVLHPIHTEPLNAIVGRADLLAAFFGLLAVWLYGRDGADLPAENRSGWRRWGRPVAAGVAFLLAVLTKENGLALIGVVALGDGLFPALRRGPHPGAAWWRRRLLRCYAPLLVVTVVYLSARVVALGSVTKTAGQIALLDNCIAHPEHGLAPGDSALLARWGTPLAVFGKAMGLMLYPHPLCRDYSYAAIETVKRLDDPRLMYGAAWLVAVAAALVLAYRQRSAALAAIGFLLITYSITSNLPVLIGTIFAERLLYLPSVGLCMLFGVVAGAAVDAWSSSTGPLRKGAGLAAMIVLAGGGLAFGRLTVNRNRDWRSGSALCAADLKTNPRSCRLLALAATNALAEENQDEALRYANQALAIDPNHAPSLRIIGLVHSYRGEKRLALEYLVKAFSLGGADDEPAVIEAATLLVDSGDYRQAVNLLQLYVGQFPLAATSRNNLAWYLITAEPPELRDPPEAWRLGQEALALSPHQAGIIDTCADVLVVLGRTAEAVRLIRERLPGVPADDEQRAALVAKLAKLETPPDAAAGEKR